MDVSTIIHTPIRVIIHYKTHQNWNRLENLDQEITVRILEPSIVTLKIVDLRGKSSGLPSAHIAIDLVKERPKSLHDHHRDLRISSSARLEINSFSYAPIGSAFESTSDLMSDRGRGSDPPSRTLPRLISLSIESSLEIERAVILSTMQQHFYGLK
ncbi:hypothetical protein BJV82DRAFT_671189 [Fennellomyces sp. T-0311]|nr:hypothetical protein BJV82DRAFT_671189 [Fennellomyces sp. T-0311]